ncbi:hypothetical protein CBR_g37519 [Chara braunii]|uniref:Uncharacterized protein n=1 Tax=Chara braunii TaxID=69332 RepID=A0A388LN21_CHABU|nr:hypothetical protein CBR_g37519 [Chara braunii]|eukprot:GBG83718.1 hypothetical protein CBR_g37519 [Chara braunii]
MRSCCTLQRGCVPCPAWEPLVVCESQTGGDVMEVVAEVVVRPVVGEAGVEVLTGGGVSPVVVVANLWQSYEQADQLVRKPRQRWDEGDFLYESSSSDDEDFFGSGTPAQDGDSDFDDRHPDVDDDDGFRGHDRGDGGDRPQPRSTQRDDDRALDEGAGHCCVEGNADAGSGAIASRPADGDTMDVQRAGGEHRTTSDRVRDGATDGCAGLVDGGGLRRLKRGPREQDTIASRVRRRHGGVPDIPKAAVPQFEQILVSEDSLSDHADEERMKVIDGTGRAGSDTFSMHATAPTGSSAATQESELDLGPSMRHPELKGDNGVLPVMDDKGSAHSMHQLTSAGAPALSVVATSDVRLPPPAAERETVPPTPSALDDHPNVGMEGVERQQPSIQGADAVDTVSRPSRVLTEGIADVCLGDDLPDVVVSRTPAAEHIAVALVGLECPTDSLPGTTDLLAMDSALASLPDLSTLISPGLPHVPTPNLQQPVAMESAPGAFDEFGGDTIVFATPTIFRVGRPHEVDLGKAETATRHHRGGHRSIAHRRSDSFGVPEGGCVGRADDAAGRSARPSSPPSRSEHHPVSGTSGEVTGVPATDTMDPTRQPAVGSSSTARRDRATVLPTVAFYATEGSAGGLDESRARIAGRPSAPCMGTRSIGSVDGARHTAMSEYEDRHGSALPTKSSDVHATRVAKASLSRARKKASERTASLSSPHMRSHIGQFGVAPLKDGEIAPNGAALDVGERPAGADNVCRDGAVTVGHAVAG